MKEIAISQYERFRDRVFGLRAGTREKLIMLCIAAEADENGQSHITLQEISDRTSIKNPEIVAVMQYLQNQGRVIKSARETYAVAAELWL